MSRKSTVLAASMLFMLVPLATASAEVTAAYTFETVDSYNIRGAIGSSWFYEVQLTGLIQGENTPRTITLTYTPGHMGEGGWGIVASHRSFERCERLILLSLNKPGQYFLEVRQELEQQGSSYHFVGCRLTRR